MLCDVPGHDAAGMTGSLTVTAGGGTAAGEHDGHSASLMNWEEAWHCHILTHAEREDGMFGMVTALIVE